MKDTKTARLILSAVVSKKQCPVEVEYKLIDGDKHRMATNAKSNATRDHFCEEGEEESTEEMLPWVKPVGETSEGWVKFDKPIIYV